MCPHTAIHVFRSHATTYASSYYYNFALIDEAIKLLQEIINYN